MNVLKVYIILMREQTKLKKLNKRNNNHLIIVEISGFPQNKQIIYLKDSINPLEFEVCKNNKTF